MPDITVYYSSLWLTNDPLDFSMITTVPQTSPHNASLQQVVVHHIAGRLSDVGKLYRAILILLARSITVVD